MRILVLLCFLFLLIACDSGPLEVSNAEANDGKIRLQIVDSLIISTLPSETFIQDIHPENGNILLMQRKGRGQILMEVAANGTILQTFEHPSDGPQRVGNSLLSACYYEDGFALMGSFGSLLFTDKQFEPRMSKRIPMNFNLAAYPGFRHLQVLKAEEKSVLVMYYGAHTKANFTEEDYYKEYDLLSMYDPETDEFSPIGDLPELSIIRNGKAHYFLDTRFQVVGEKIKATIVKENLLYTMDLNSSAFEYKSIPFDNFVLHEGFSLGPQGLDEQGEIREISGTIRSYLSVGDKEVFVYSSGLTLDARRAIAGDGEDQEAWIKLRKALPNKYLITKDGEAVSGFLSLPPRIGLLTMVDAGGNIWASQNVEALDEEPEVITLYKLRIVEN
jgi:hypothetical protein